jgi:7-keto-8-aminopelargonate synthetase-like enzyme
MINFIDFIIDESFNVLKPKHTLKFMKKTTKTSGIINTINEILTIARSRKIVHLTTEDESLDGRRITIDGKTLINFGSCSYLGLETDQRIKDASCIAVQRYGSQFSSSRTYVSFTLYSELEKLLEKIFNTPVLIAPSTTLGHLGVIPIVIEDNDAVILDQQAHYSMQEVVHNLQLRGITVTKLRHNRLDELQIKINELSHKHNRIWYVIDGVYSMYGDLAPINQIVEMLNDNKKLHLYVDDAHGMSWEGKHGSGKILSQIKFHPKMVMATSLAKGFGSAGGVFIFPNEELFWRVKNWGGPLTHSGPQQPAVIGASIASARIHLSDEIYERQNLLRENIKFCNEIFRKYNLPVIAESGSPIFFIGLGLTKVGYNMVRRIADDGFYVNLGIYPAVPENCTGIRFTITTHHTKKDIENLAKTIAIHLPKVLEEEERTRQDITRAFRSVMKLQDKKEEQTEEKTVDKDLRFEYLTSIKYISKEVWNNLLGKNGSFDWNGLLFLEEVFSNNEKPEDNWQFHYYIIRDSFENPVLATFFTTVLTKDDMLAPAEVSKKIEQQRLTTPDFLISKCLMMGTLLTYGNHLYLNKSSLLWKKAFMILIDSVWKEQEKEDLSSIYFRDLDANDMEVRDFLMDQGFVKFDLPDNHVIISKGFKQREDYISHLNSKKRNLLKANILKYEDLFVSKVADNPSEEQINIWFDLYNNVRERKFEINGFPLPKKLFFMMAKSKSWECLELIIKDMPEMGTVAVMFNYKNDNYSSMIVGMNYEYLEEYRIYKQILFQTIIKGIESKSGKIYFGLTASLEKRKLGAEAVSQVAYIQMKDNFNLSLISMIPNIKSETGTIN